MRVSNRIYSTELHFSDARLIAAVTTVPPNTELGRKSHVERIRELTGAQLTLISADSGQPAGESSTMRSLREMLGVLIIRARHGEEASAPITHVTALIAQGESRHFGALSSAEQDMVDYLLSAPVLTHEGSWPSVNSLAAVALTAGGVGLATLGLATEQGNLVDYGAVITSTASVVIAVRPGDTLRAPLARQPSAAAGPGDLPQLERTIAVIADAPVLGEDKKQDLIYQVTKQHIERMAE